MKKRIELLQLWGARLPVEEKLVIEKAIAAKASKEGIGTLFVEAPANKQFIQHNQLKALKKDLAPIISIDISAHGIMDGEHCSEILGNVLPTRVVARNVSRSLGQFKGSKARVDLWVCHATGADDAIESMPEQAIWVTHSAVQYQASSGMQTEALLKKIERYSPSSNPFMDILQTALELPETMAVNARLGEATYCFTFRPPLRAPHNQEELRNFFKKHYIKSYSAYLNQLVEVQHPWAKEAAEAVTLLKHFKITDELCKAYVPNWFATMLWHNTKPALSNALKTQNLHPDDIKTSSHQTLLHRGTELCALGDEQFVFLVNHGADPFVKDKQGISAFEKIIQHYGNDGVIFTLDYLDQKKQLDRTSLEAPKAALKLGNTEALRLILSYGFDVNARNAKGETLLTYAAALPPGSKVNSCVRLLLAQGADASMMVQGKTAKEIAQQNGNTVLAGLVSKRDLWQQVATPNPKRQKQEMSFLEPQHSSTPLMSLIPGPSASYQASLQTSSSAQLQPNI